MQGGASNSVTCKEAICMPGMGKLSDLEQFYPEGQKSPYLGMGM